MSEKIGNFIKVIFVIALIVAAIVYYKFVFKIFTYAITFILSIIIIGIAFYIFYFLIEKTKKWLTVGLDKTEKDVSVVILAVIIYGSIFYGIHHLLVLYVGPDKIPMFMFRNFIGTIIMMFFYAIIFLGIKTVKQEHKDTTIFLTFFFILSITSSIIFDYFFGEKIVSWLSSYWYYLLGGLILLGIISVLIENYKKKNQPLN